MKQSPLLQLLSAVLALLGLAFCFEGLSVAQPGPGIPQPPSINFENKTPKPLIVQGISFVKGVVRKGQPLLIPPNKSSWDNNVPPGPRHYRVYDGTQPARMLSKEPIQVLVGAKDIFLTIIPDKATGSVQVLPNPAP